MTTPPEPRDQAVAPASGPDHDRHRLVVGDDGSAAADVVWLWVNSHRWAGWRISVLTATPPKAGPPVGKERAAPHPWSPPHPRLLLGQDDVLVEHLVAEADPRLALDSCVDAGLVAIGPRGRGVLKHLHVGSTAEWLVSHRRPLAPVVVVRSGHRTSSVLVCVDGSDHARSAVTTLAELPWIADCRLTVLGVNDGRVDTTAGVDEAVEMLRARGLTEVHPRVIESPPAPAAQTDPREAVLAVVRADEPDLVAVGARGLGGVQGLLVGSLTSAVVHHAPCSVLVARSG